MGLIKSQTLKGFRDFLPQEAIIRRRLSQKIADVLEKFGYEPLETPALEYAETLLGKYGNEADRLLYLFTDRGGRNVGLRYDQTVPLARVVSQYPQLPQPFKRYQIQPVWRAENTQKGRYREFIQCDFDIVGGENKLMADAEILAVVWEIYISCGLSSIQLVVNSRSILKSLLSQVLKKEIDNAVFLSLVRSLDKLDKIGQEEVANELRNKGLTAKQTTDLFAQISNWKSFSFAQMASLDPLLSKTLTLATQEYAIPDEQISFNPALSRGLDYYTGMIVEVILPGSKGSLGGGGRYDNLISQFIGKNIPAVGFAIGFDRTIEVLKEKNLLPQQETVSQAIILIRNDNSQVLPTAIKLAKKLRKMGKNIEIYLDCEKDLAKQLKYAAAKKIPKAIIIGEEEINSQQFTLKDLVTRNQQKYSLQELINNV